MKPTRGKACLDNICANDNGPKVIDARVINNHFSDHFAQTVSMQFSENTDSHCNEIYYRDLQNENNIVNFISLLKNYTHLKIIVGKFRTVFSLCRVIIKKIPNGQQPLPHSSHRELRPGNVLKKQNAQNLGAAFQTFLERDGANMIGDAISNFGKENAGQILQGLGSLMANQGGKKEGGDGEDTGTNVLEGLGSLMGALQGAGGGGAGDVVAPLLQGLGSLIGGQGGQGGIDPAMIGSMMNMFAQSMEKPRKGKPSKKVDQKRAKNEPKFDMSSLLSIAGSFLEQTKAGGGSDEGNLLTYLPLIAQFIGSFSGPEAERRARQHDDHAWSLPPYLEKWHIIFDHFIHSDMGKYVISALGAEKTFKVFSDGEGRFSYQKFGELMENHSFRRHWIRMVTDRIAGFLQYAADPTVYKTYFSSGHFLLNSYLNSLGFPQTTLFDPARPVETISALANHVAKIYFDFPIQSKEYVQSAVSYVQVSSCHIVRGLIMGDETRNAHH
ncbi:hypothetical protein JTB14_005064 [Gonioctena quinquepunctata]|nr:hypothetical protein JTB14_005064 [Gonioctena quinquepunctata]